TTGTQSYTGAVTISANDTLTTTNGLVSFGGPIDDSAANSHSLAIAAGTGGVTFGGAVGGNAELASLDTTGTPGTNTLDGNVKTGGTQSYGGQVGLGASDTLSGSTVTFANTVDGAHALTLTGHGVFDGAVGFGTKLSSLSVSGTTDINGGGVTTTGTQSYTGAVTISANDTLTTTNGLVSFGGPIDDSAANSHSLAIAAGTGGVTFGGAVGGNAELASLDTTGTPGTNTLDGNVKTGGAQSYGGPGVLGASDTLSGSTVTFANTVDGAHALTVTGNGGFDGAVGFGTKLSSLSVSGTTDINGGGVTTTGTQSYTGAVTISANDTLTTTNGLVSFGEPIDDSAANSHSLAIAAGTGGVTFGGAVGGNAELASLDTTGTPGTNTLDGNVKTGGTQSYGGPVVLGASDTLSGSTIAVGAISTGEHNA